MAIPYLTSSTSPSPSCKDDTGTNGSSSTRPQLRRSKTSAVHNAAMREITKPFADLSVTPPECQAVSFSSWTRFSPSDYSSKSSEDLRASVLWTATATTPEFDPPLLERTYLGVDQPDPVICGGPNARVRAQMRGKRRRTGTTSSWTTTSSARSAAPTSEPITFRKENVKGAATSSLLTESFQSSPPRPEVEMKHPKVTLEDAKQYGIDELSNSNLPTAWDSESEGESESLKE